MNSKSLTATQKKTRYLVQLAMWTALTLVLGIVPNLGYLPIPPFNPTIVHIPVIIGAIMLGPAAGAFLGFVMGVTSIIQATMIVPITGFMFSPFLPLGNGWSAVIAIVPRVCIGLVAAYIYKAIKIRDKRGYVASLIAGAAGSFINTILVLGGGYIFFGQQYSSKTGIAFNTLLTIILTTVATNGVIEAIIAAVAAAAITKALTAAMKRR